MNLYEVKVVARKPESTEVETVTREEGAVTKMDAIVQVIDKLHDEGFLVREFPTVRFLDEVH